MNMEWLKNTSWLIPNWAWIAIAAVIVIFAIVIIAVAVSGSKKKKNNAKSSQTVSTEPNDVKSSVSETSEEQSEEKSDRVKEEKAAKTESVKTSKTEDNKTVKAEDGKTAKTDNAAKTEEQEKTDSAAKPTDDKKAANKVYHISKRKDDGKWQVKLAGGSKALKLFKTQAEAIDYAKALAETQEARIVIHKTDGSFRNLTYGGKK